MKIRTALITAIALALAAPLAAGASKLGPPVVREKFTPLPCSSGTTIGREGCAEQQILRTDKTINSLARSIFYALSTRGARLDFIAAQRSWVSFRRADCLSVSDVYRGGTEAGVLDAQCSATRNRERITELKAFLALLRSA